MGSFYNDEEKIEEEYYQAFIEIHQARLRILDVPECKWRTLCKKLRLSMFDAGDHFMYASEVAEDEEDNSESSLRVYTKCSMRNDDEQHIYLIDHAWSYTLDTAKKVLEDNPNLVKRMKSVMGISDEDGQSNIEAVKKIMDKMWEYNNCCVARCEEQVSSGIAFWYILDEFGSRIRYSDDPSFQIVPFSYADDGCMYSLIFPKSEVAEEEEVTVAFPNAGSLMVHSDLMKKATHYPWHPSDFSQIDFQLFEPSVEYFASGRQKDILPEIEWTPPLLENSTDNYLNVYTDYLDVKQFLTHPLFHYKSDKDEANILWTSVREYNIRDLIEKYPKFCYISQFPSEQVLINKDLLAVVCRRTVDFTIDSETLKSYPDWLPTTFNLKTELPQFISFFQNREKKNMENIWICKPFNLARGMNIHITDNLKQIIRMAEALPMVACKYVTDPVLFPSDGNGLVKMDLRYIVLLRNTDPLEVFVYDRFWIRFANKPFALEDFDDYERHFTVMNYVAAPLQQMYCHDFIEKFEDYYASYKWCDIQEKINKMIKKVFISATLKEPPAGLGRFKGSRAIYGFDIMLEWDRNHEVPEMKPVILEVNWMPDCKRACQYYSEFYNDIFSVLFLGDTKDKHVELL